ncbi:MAG: hypothetical protein WCE23_01790 [Candidatus Binatus sp.]|uniref:hypothetical protein n=1 Tax=Candidatus Binatus sp. TaxID=2811406 RepID=UPI003C77F520
MAYISTSKYARLVAQRKTGREAFRMGGLDLGPTLYEFWAWSVSDFVSNATRGRLAEFIVANALAIPTTVGVRDEWGAYDLETPEGTKVEVKSAAYIQAWYQTRLSMISFRTRKTRAYNHDTGQLDHDARRQADVYVFAHLKHEQKETIDPLDIDQWNFYVLSTAVLNARTRSQYGITLATLKKQEGAGPFTYSELRAAVQRAANSANNA